MSEKEYLHDMRVVDRYIEEGKVSQKDHDKFIKDLEDVTEKSETLVIEEDSVEEEEEEKDKEEKDDDEMGV